MLAMLRPHWLRAGRVYACRYARFSLTFPDDSRADSLGSAWHGILRSVPGRKVAWHTRAPHMHACMCMPLRGGARWDYGNVEISAASPARLLDTAS